MKFAVFLLLLPVFAHAELRIEPQGDEVLVTMDDQGEESDWVDDEEATFEARVDERLAERESYSVPNSITTPFVLSHNQRGGWKPKYRVTYEEYEE